MDLKDVAVIIAAKNEENNIEACLRSVLENARDEAEVWLVDDGSTDQTLSIAEKVSPRIRILKLGGVGPSVARNQAVAATDKSLIAFVDADAQAEKDWLWRLKEVLLSAPPKVSSVGGLQTAHQSAAPEEKKCVRFLESLGFASDYIHADDRIREVDHNPTCNVMYRKEVLHAVKGFDENMWPCEDLDLDLRLKKMGYVAMYTPRAVVQHKRVENFPQLLKMFQRYGFGHARLVRRHGLCQPIHFLMLVFLVMLMAMASGAFFYPQQTFLIIVGLFMMGFFLFKFRRNDTARSVQFAIWLPACLLKWFRGFLQGVLASRGIASHV